MVETFQYLIYLFTALVGMNLVFSFILWRTTKSNLFLILGGHWITSLITFYLSGALAEKPPFERLFFGTFVTFISIYLASLVLAKPLKIAMPLKKFIFVPVIACSLIYLFARMDLDPFIIALPSVTSSSFCFLYVSIVALRRHRKSLTASMKSIVVLYILYGLHFYDFAYFYDKFDLLAIGFTIALVFHLAITLFVPAMIIEETTREKAALENEIILNNKLANASKMAALGEVAGGLAHEVNNPLTILSLQIASMKKAFQSNTPVTATSLDEMEQVVFRITKIITGFKSISKDATQEEFVAILAGDVLSETLLLCSEKFKSRGVRLETTIDQALWKNRTKLLKNQLSQALLGLLYNACDAASQSVEKWTKVEAEFVEESLVIRITDSGKGVPKDIKEKIFQPFFTTKEVSKGTGLGLSSAFACAENHGGELYLDEKSQNTSFILSVPR